MAKLIFALLLQSVALQAKASNPWQPGDAIPGWPDYDCGVLPTGANVLFPVLREVEEVGADFIDAYSTMQPASWIFAATDCNVADADPPCDSEVALTALLSDGLRRPADDGSTSGESWFGTGWFESEGEVPPRATDWVQLS